MSKVSGQQVTSFSISSSDDLVFGFDGSYLPPGNRVVLQVQDKLTGLWYGAMTGSVGDIDCSVGRRYRIWYEHNESASQFTHIGDIVRERDELRAKLAKIQEAAQ